MKNDAQGFALRKEETFRRIRELKQQKNAIILAHYYQEADIQEVADYIGDSLGLSQKAAATDADIIVFAGVHFMAETAAILCPDKKVLLPDLNAGCSLEESCPPDRFARFVAAHSDYTVITYVNCSAEVKALSDILCTSANAEAVLRSVPEDQPVIFAPDRNLGHYLQNKTGRQMLLWDGACVVHEAFSEEKLRKLMDQHPGARLIAHPESQQHILQLADYIGSTSGMIKYVKDHPGDTFIVATEAGILHEMSRFAEPGKLIPAPAYEQNACACSECPYMKMNTLDKLLSCLENEYPVVSVPRPLAERALVPLKRMLEISA